jgi:hypothetical protein
MVQSARAFLTVATPDFPDGGRRNFLRRRICDLGTLVLRIAIGNSLNLK